MTPDPTLRRIERRALVFTIVGAVVAWLVPGGGWRGAASVGGGALLIGASYWVIWRGVSGFAAAAVARANAGDPAPRRPGRRGVALVAVRYALLAGMAYVMIARLRLPPIGLLIGASAITVAAALEIARRPGRT